MDSNPTTVEQRLVRRSQRSPASDLMVTVVASVSIALPLLFYLHQHVEMLRHGYEIEALEERRTALVERGRELEVARAEAASLSRVEEQARILGLEAPAPGDVYSAKGPRTLVPGVPALGGSDPPSLADCPPIDDAPKQARLE